MKRANLNMKHRMKTMMRRSAGAKRIMSFRKWDISAASIIKAMPNGKIRHHTQNGASRALILIAIRFVIIRTILIIINSFIMIAMIVVSLLFIDIAIIVTRNLYLCSALSPYGSYYRHVLADSDDDCYCCFVCVLLLWLLSLSYD